MLAGSSNTVFAADIQNTELNDYEPQPDYGNIGQDKRCKAVIRDAKEICSFDNFLLPKLNDKKVAIAFFDIDLTLICQKGILPYLDDDTRLHYLVKFLHSKKSDLTYEELSDFNAFVTEAIASAKWDVEVVEDSVLSLLEEMKKQGVLIFGLTSRKFRIADKTDKSLVQLGINFREGCVFNSNINACFDEGGTMGFQNGIFYTGNALKKAEFIPFIVTTLQDNFKMKGPFAVYHFDDNKNEIDAFSKADYSTLPNIRKVQPFYYVAYFENLKFVCNNEEEVDSEYLDYYMRYNAERTF